MLTIKSDDVYGRAKAYESIIKNEPIMGPKIPESFNVLVKELQGLGLRVDLVENEAVVDAENVLVGDTVGTSSGIVLPDDDGAADDEETVGDEADEFGDIELDEGMSIETAEEFETIDNESEEV